ncbi:MAG: hypothetical protein WD894_26745 [Pirellulales bacterium]
MATPDRTDSAAQAPSPGAVSTLPQIRSPVVRRRWLRFSLRTMLIVITVLSVWLGVKVDQARKQKRAVDTLRAFGADIRYEHHRGKNGLLHNADNELNVPAWARQLCGDDFFQTVRGIYFLQLQRPKQTRPHRITDEELKCLADLPHLERLYIDNAPITDAGLAHLRHPEYLREVNLRQTKVGDDFVRRLSDSERLQVLVLDGTKVTDESLAELSGVATLLSLSLEGTKTGDRALAAFAERELVVLRPGSQTTDAGLQQFKTLAKIEDFEAQHCQITGEAFRGFRLPKADEIHLRNCAVSDDDLPPLVQAVRDVRVLSLSGCSITDGGLHYLRRLGKTEILILSNTKVQGRSLQQLSTLPALQGISLRGCPLDKPDLKALQPLFSGLAPGVRLTLDKTPVGDDDLAQLSGLTNLMYLSLSDTSVSDAGLPHLYKLTKLAVLDLRGTRVTAAGVKQLKQAIPGTDVGWSEEQLPAAWTW